MWIAWAYLPERTLHALGVSYFPSKHWAIALPAWVLLLAVYIFWAYESHNMTQVLPLESLGTIHDGKSKWRERVGIASVVQSTQRSIPPLVHVPAPLVSRVLYGCQPVAGGWRHGMAGCWWGAAAAAAAVLHVG